MFHYNGGDSDPFRFAEDLDVADTIEFNPAGSKRRIGKRLNALVSTDGSAPDGWSATLPELALQGSGLIPIRSFTADEIRWVQPTTLCGLHADVAKEKLNLLQFATSGTAEASATSTEGRGAQVC